jgi:hypothetical protein
VSHAVTFSHGPEATPFIVDEQGGVVDAAGRTPFHGILSRGLLERAGRAGAGNPLPPWGDNAHLLDAGSRAEATDDERAAEPWRRAAADCGVLTFAQSATCARALAERVAGEIGLPPDAGIALWSAREGHTSSVWRVRLGGAHEFAVNVARDRIAGEELRRTMSVLRRIGDEWPEANIARVLEIAEVQPSGVAWPVVVTRNEWIAGGLEIHRLPPLDGLDGALVAVDRFIADDDAPAVIRSIRGRRLTEAEVARVTRDMAEFLDRGAGHSVQLDINDGDLVWDGRRAVVVAIR